MRRVPATGRHVLGKPSVPRLPVKAWSSSHAATSRPSCISIGQNIASRENERRHQLDLQIHLLNEREMTALLRLMAKVADKLEISRADQAEARTFGHNTDPLALLDQIVTAERAARQPS
jgi:uncharacterized membrane protein